MEAWTFRRNLFFVPRAEYALYRHACQGIERWGESDAAWLAATSTPEVIRAGQTLKEQLQGMEGFTARELWERPDLADKWDKYRRQHAPDDNLPIFRAFYRLIRRGDLLCCGRRPGTFREPVFILREKAGFPDWTQEAIDSRQAMERIIEKLIASFGVTNPVHIAHISGYQTADAAPVFARLAKEGRIQPLPQKIGRKQFFVHASKLPLLSLPEPDETHGVRPISPMDTLVRDKAWLSALFDYSFSFEYFKKKGMKWPLSILVGTQFVGYVDCRMDWKSGRFIVRERSVTDPRFHACKAIDLAIEELAAFHHAASVILP